MANPPNLTYCKIIGNFKAFIADSLDTDDLPDFIPMTGSGQIYPNLTSAKSTTPGFKSTYYTAPIPVTIDIDGDLTRNGEKYVMVLAPNETSGINPHDFTYTIKLTLGILGETSERSFGPYSFYPIPGGEIDLVDIIPVAISAGTPIIQGPQGIQGKTGVQGIPGIADDASIAQQIGTPGSLTQTSLNAAIGAQVELPTSPARAALDPLIAGTFRGVPGKRYRTIAGVLRNTGAGWSPIQDATHEPTNLGVIETSATQITLNYPEINGLKVVSLVAVCDEVLADAGFTVGASVENNRTFLRIHRTSPVSDYITYNGTVWTSANGSSTFEAMSPGGVLQINHPPVGNSSNIYDVSLASRGGVLSPALTNNGPALTLTSVRVEFKDWAGVTQTSPTTDMKLFYSHSGHGTVDPTTVNTTNFPGSNIWVIGVFEVSD